MSEVVSLRPVAVTDLNARYARDMGENKVRHYILPLSLSLVKKFVGQDAQSLIRDYIEKTEGVKDVVFEDGNAAGIFETEESDTRIIQGAFSVTDVSKFVLGGDAKIGRALMKVKAHGTLHQWTYYPSIFHKIFDNLIYFYNKNIVPNVNRILYKLQGADYSVYNHFVKQISRKDSIGNRRVDQAHFISVAFEAGDAEEAMKALRDDLKILQKNKLILGSLCMPSVMALANEIGLGNYHVMFCFPIVDHERLMKILGKSSYLDMPQKDQLALVGVKNETYEGGVRWLNGVEPRKKFQVEDVYITDLDAPSRDQQVMDCYNQSVDHVNDIAKTMKENLANMDKVESNSRTIYDSSGRPAVALDVKMQNKKTGDILDVKRSYENADNSHSILEEIKWRKRRENDEE